MACSITPVSSARVSSLVLELQTVGDRFEKRGNANWLPIARAAMILESLRLGVSFAPDFNCAGVAALIVQLEFIADQNEGLAAWAVVTKAASLLEGIRLGMTTVADDAPSDNWFQFDLTPAQTERVHSNG